MTEQNRAPILSGKHYETASAFTPESLLREARRQKGLPAVVVPESLELAISYIDDGQLRDEAIVAASRIAELLLPTHPKEASAAIKKILAVSIDKALKARLERQLKKR